MKPSEVSVRPFGNFKTLLTETGRLSLSGEINQGSLVNTMKEPETNPYLEAKVLGGVENQL